MKLTSLSRLPLLHATRLKRSKHTDSGPGTKGSGFQTIQKDHHDTSICIQDIHCRGPCTGEGKCPTCKQERCIAIGLLPKEWPHIPVQALSIKDTDMKKTKEMMKRFTAGEATKEQLIKEFESVFQEDCPLKEMQGPPMKIELEPDAVPVCWHKAYTIPLHWQEKVKAQLDSM